MKIAVTKILNFTENNFSLKRVEDLVPANIQNGIQNNTSIATLLVGNYRLFLCDSFYAGELAGREWGRIEVSLRSAAYSLFVL